MRRTTCAAGHCWAGSPCGDAPSGSHQHLGRQREGRAREALLVHQADGGRPVAVAVEECSDDAA